MQPTASPRQVEALCPACSRREVWGLEAAIRMLTRQGRLRRGAAPDPTIVFELLFAFAGELICPSCDGRGLRLQWLVEDEEGWLEAVLCERCRKPIPEERLQAVPGAELCVACQSVMDRARQLGAAPPLLEHEIEYCPRCGRPMRVEIGRGEGIARYRSVCANYPACRG